MNAELSPQDAMLALYAVFIIGPALVWWLLLLLWPVLVACVVVLDALLDTLAERWNA